MAGRTLGPAQELQLTPERRMAEAMSASLVRPWLEAMVRELAASYGIPWPDSLAKALRSPSLDELRATFQANARRSGEQRKLLEQEVALQADEMGEARLLKVLERAAKLGRSEAARAFLGEDNLREALGRKLSPATVERLRTTARRNVRLIRATTERALADIASRPSPDNLDALLARLYSTHRASLVGLNTTALGYSEGVASVLKEMRVGHVYVRTMADDRVCPKCHAVESNPELARMTVRQFLARYPLHPKCLTAGHLIMTPSGEKPIEEVRPGDMVITHLGRARQVLRTRKEDLESFGYRITTKDGKVLTATGEHPFLTQRGWVQARDLLSTDHLLSHEAEEHANRFGQEDDPWRCRCKPS